jgi:hypothetical protein
MGSPPDSGQGRGVSRLPDARAWPGGLTGRALTVFVVGLAGLIHLMLTPEHFAEQPLSGLVFTALALFQLALALLLVWRPTPLVCRLGIWGSTAIVLLFLGTRLIPPPGAAAPEEVEPVGILATGLELIAVLLLALALPDPPTQRRRWRAGWWGVSGALLVLVGWPILTGMLQWLPTASPPALTWVTGADWSWRLPALVGSPLPHLWLVAPWWSLPALPLLALLVGLQLWQVSHLIQAGRLAPRARRQGLLSLVPAGLAVPSCCTASTPLLVALGVPLNLGVLLAPGATALSLLLLLATVGGLWWQWRRLRRYQHWSQLRQALCTPAEGNPPGVVAGSNPGSRQPLPSEWAPRLIHQALTISPEPSQAERKPQ